MILTQAPTIQRMSQRFILALAASTKSDLCLRDISQAYAHSTTSLNRRFYARPPQKLGLKEDSILKLIKSLYRVPEAGAQFDLYNFICLQ